MERVITLTGSAWLLARLCVDLHLDDAVVAIVFKLERLDIRLALRLEAVLGPEIDWSRKPWVVKRWGAEGIKSIVVVGVRYRCAISWSRSHWEVRSYFEGLEYQNIVASCDSARITIHDLFSAPSF